jgi:tetratricopeptide (TPR) repeat protein
MRSVLRSAGFVLAAVLATTASAANAPRKSVASPAGETALPARPPEAPMGLTASDGTGLRLVRMVGRAVVEEPLAFTELHLSFENPQARTIEGHFRITLPQGATISRFAMKIGDRWQEGEVVEKQAARRAYEDFLHRRQDPALLEQAAGNEFSARVFPIPARGIKELVVSYSQELTSSTEPYILPLRGLPELGELDLKVMQAGNKPLEMKRTRFVPSKDLVYTPKRGPGRSGLRHASLAVARVAPLASAQPDPIDSLLVLVDTSASRALGLGEQARLVQQLVEGFARGGGAGIPLVVGCFDQAVELVFDGKTGGFGQKEARAITSRRALGASDLGRALAWAREQAEKRKIERVLLLTDGVATAGATEGDELIAATLRLKRAGVKRLDAIAAGGIRDDALLRRLVTAGLARDGVVADAADGLARIAKRLTNATRSNLEVKVADATWYWPKRLDGIQPGDEVLVYAELPPGKPMELSIGGSAVKVGELVSVGRPLLERALVQAKIASLLHKRDCEADGAEQKKKIQDEIVALSVGHRVLSPYTALLVLETEQDYARFGIDRKALADILTVDHDGRIALMKRGPESVAAVATRDKKPSSEKVAKAKKRMAPAASAEMSAVAPLDSALAEAEKEIEAAPQADAYGDGQMGAPAPAPEAMAPAAASREEVVAERSIARASTASTAVRRSAERRRTIVPEARPAPRVAAQDQAPQGADPYVGKFKEVMSAIARSQAKAAITAAVGWREEDPGDVMALVAMGEAFEAAGELELAARAYGSIIDLFSGRADLRRFAGQRLERLRGGVGLDLAADTYAKAALQRPDHPASHRLHAFALLKRGEPEKAFEVMLVALQQRYPSGRFAGVDRILREDLGLIAAAWIKKEPGKRAEILNRVKAAGGVVEDKPSLRFVLNWETDANDVDFHIYDARGGHAYYSNPELPSGGELYADVTTGYGPECFTIRLPKGKRAGPYKLQAHYYSRGPMGYGMGKLQIIDHDGKGGLSFEERPFVVMVDGAYLDLGSVRD